MERGGLKRADTPRPPPQSGLWAHNSHTVSFPAMRPSHIQQILDREFLSAAVGAHTPVMLWGPPGVGKSQIIGGIALAHGVSLIDVRLSQMEPTDLRGIPFR